VCTYRRQLISTGGTSTVSVAEEESERSTILCNIYPSCLLIYLALYLVPSYGPLPPLLRPLRSTLLTAGIYIPIYTVRLLFYASLLPLIHCLFFLSAHHLFFVARMVYEAHISAYKTAGASFCLLRDNYRRSLRRRLHPKAVIPVGVIDSRNF